MPLVHHELCFGCGRANLFGLMLEIEETAAGSVAGRCFIKQDHQGAERGFAHEGVLAAALSEAMALACGADARAVDLRLALGHRAPVGSFVQIEARAEHQAGSDSIRASAWAGAEGEPIATARGRYQRR